MYRRTDGMNVFRHHEIVDRTTHCNICFNQPDFALVLQCFLLFNQIWCNICSIFPLLLLIRPTFNAIWSKLVRFVYFFGRPFAVCILRYRIEWTKRTTVLLVLETKQTTNNQIKFYSKTCLMKIAVDLFKGSCCTNVCDTVCRWVWFSHFFLR